MDFFSQNSNRILLCQHFFTNKFIFLSMLSVGIRFWVQKGLEKTYIHFRNNTLPVGTVTYKLLIIYGEFDLFNQIYLFSRHQKSHVTLVTILIFFEWSYTVPHSSKVS